MCCVKHPHVWVLTDDMYEHLVYDDFKFSTPAQVEPRLYERTLTVNGVSKAYCMTGWRIGYAGGPAELIKAMATIQSQSTSNPSSIAQWAAVEALERPAGFHPEEQRGVQGAPRSRGVDAEPGARASPARRRKARSTSIRPAPARSARRAPSGKVIARRRGFRRPSCSETEGVAVVQGSAFGARPGVPHLLRDANRRSRRCLPPHPALLREIFGNTNPLEISTVSGKAYSGKRACSRHGAFLLVPLRYQKRLPRWSNTMRLFQDVRPDGRGLSRASRCDLQMHSNLAACQGYVACWSAVAARTSATWSVRRAHLNCVFQSAGGCAEGYVRHHPHVSALISASPETPRCSGLAFAPTTACRRGALAGSYGGRRYQRIGWPRFRRQLPRWRSGQHLFAAADLGAGPDRPERRQRHRVSFELEATGPGQAVIATTRSAVIAAIAKRSLRSPAIAVIDVSDRLRLTRRPRVSGPFLLRALRVRRCHWAVSLAMDSRSTSLLRSSPGVLMVRLYRLFSVSLPPLFTASQAQSPAGVQVGVFELHGAEPGVGFVVGSVTNLGCVLTGTGRPDQPYVARSAKWASILVLPNRPRWLGPRLRAGEL